MNKLFSSCILATLVTSSAVAVELRVKLSDAFLERDGKYRCRLLAKENEHQKIFLLDINNKTATVTPQQADNAQSADQMQTEVKNNKIYIKTDACIQKLEVQVLESNVKNKVAVSTIPSLKTRLKQPRTCKGHKWLLDISPDNELLITLTHW